MSLFSKTDRKNVMDYIISFTEHNEHIAALVAVGSGSYGFNDGLSDLDFVIAIDSDENMEMVMEYVRSQLSKCLNFIYFKQIPQKRLQVYLTDNYLEIDIGYGAYTSAAAIRSIGRCSLISQERWKSYALLLGEKRNGFQNK